jgi:hypothetical protein
MRFPARHSDRAAVANAPSPGGTAVVDKPRPPPDPALLQTSRPLLEAEKQRLLHGPAPGTRPQGFLVRFSAPGAVNPVNVLEKARTVLVAVDDAVLAGWPAEDEWASQLPAWFVSECAPEKSPNAVEREMEAHAALPWGERAHRAQTEKWPLLEWVYWFRPGERSWYWWDGSVQAGDRKVVVEVVAEGSPFASGALDWLLRASGSGPLDESE